MNKVLALLLLVTVQLAHAAPITCVGAKECEMMWSKAQTALSSVSNMRIRLLTDSRIETFAPFDARHVGAVVTKVPDGEGYRIEFRAECSPGGDCSEIQRLTADLFETIVRQK